MSIEPENQSPNDQSEAPEGSQTPKAKPKVTATKSGSTAHVIKTTLDVSKSNVKTLDVLAAVSGASDRSVFSVSLALVNNYERSKKVVATVVEIATSEPMESGVLAVVCATEDAGLFKLIWALTREFSETLSATPPASKTKAGVELAKELQSLSEESLSVLKKVEKVLA